MNGRLGWIFFPVKNQPTFWSEEWSLQCFELYLIAGNNQDLCMKESVCRGDLSTRILDDSQISPSSVTNALGLRIMNTHSHWSFVHGYRRSPTTEIRQSLSQSILVCRASGQWSQCMHNRELNCFETLKKWWCFNWDSCWFLCNWQRANSPVFARLSKETKANASLW